jgi:predicted nuclease of restriction endonuclease-like (RecB) superfamily
MNELNISSLALQISNLHEYIQKRVLQQVNNALSIRNWLIGLYIVEYEQNGNDTAVYGLKVMKELADRLKSIKGMSSTQLYLYKDFYKTYPEFFPTVSGFLQNSGFQHDGIFLTVSGKFGNEISNQQKAEHSLPAEVLLSRLSFSHFIELIKAETPLKRAFYEVESVKNNWSVRELNRAMSTLLFERTGLSINKEAVIAKAKNEIATLPSDIVKNPYFLEFLGLEEKPEYSESNLEQAIIDHLQKFLVELGRGFCFEARQKRITFDNKHYRIDLVFYNRILKCHVLLDLKVGEFDHADAGQMNMYLNYYRKNEMTEGDNPPVGIILCANKNDALVEYATFHSFCQIATYTQITFCHF